MSESKIKNNKKEELYSIINKVYTNLNTSVDGWYFKEYILTILFYKFLSENTLLYFYNLDIDFISLDSNEADSYKSEFKKNNGYFLYPAQLYSNFLKRLHTNKETDARSYLQHILESIENTFVHKINLSSIFKQEIHYDQTKINSTLFVLLNEINNIPSYTDLNLDVFGSIYEHLMTLYVSKAGKTGGEFFTPFNISELLSRIVISGQKEIKGIYDPTCGSGSLLLKFVQILDRKGLTYDCIYGQEINKNTANLAKINMMLHGVNFKKFDIAIGDTLTHPHFADQKPFDAIVSNPPYSVKWIGSDDPTLINDDRFAPAGVLAPKSKADFAFVLHALSYLSNRGRAAIVCFPGIFYRGGAEQKIRKYLVDNNFVQAVIALAPNLFYGTSIAVSILVLAKNKPDTHIQFIDASGDAFFKKETNHNVMYDDHIDQIIHLFDQKENVPHVAQSVAYKTVVEQEYNLSVSTYVEPKDTTEVIDITTLNADIKKIVAKQAHLRTQIDAIVADLEGDK